VESEDRRSSPFGEQLRHWRRRAGISQLELATRASTTPRHLSFLETGRSRPGRSLVLRLAEELEVPLGERNALLAAAGLPPAFASARFTDDSMRPVRRVVNRVLEAHEPFPAWVVGRGLRFISSNAAAERVFPGMCAMSPEQVIDAWFTGPFRDLVENWQDIVWSGIAGLRREASRSSDLELDALARRAEARAVTIPRPEQYARPDLPVVCPRLRIGDRVIRTIATVMRFDTAIDVTLSDLRVELMFPADDESEAWFRSLAPAVQHA
jgi:transcriptional regulator with XRE-family HTH domain